ncbi:Robl_LC7 [Nesidiocoris tenuis]|uniref:Dynein light chain roadblock n=1 Tax=Nesidiocoris tenuis TaxID=355587 RepID=A0ABN7B642_9HEMI|nr:Robl_LC7 [Nesidiocoris tenuis]
MTSEVDDTLKRIQSHKGVVGIIVINSDGVPIKSTLDNTTTVQYAALMTQLCDKSRSAIRDLDPTNDLTFLRLRSKKHEIMIAPDKDFILIVIQAPTE